MKNFLLKIEYYYLAHFKTFNEAYAYIFLKIYSILRLKHKLFDLVWILLDEMF